MTRPLKLVKFHVRWTFWQSFKNWVKGYQWGPVQRFRCCEHTTPYHYPACALKGGPTLS